MTDLAAALLDALDDAALDRLAVLLAPRLARHAPLSPGDTPPVAAYTVATLAADLGVSERTVRGAIACGELPAVRRGRRYLIAPEAVAAWTRATTIPRRRRARPRAATRGRGPLAAALADEERRAA